MSKVRVHEVEYVRLDGGDFTVVETRNQFRRGKEWFNLIQRAIRAERDSVELAELCKPYTKEDAKCVR
jgi:hypothetical protein